MDKVIATTEQKDIECINKFVATGSVVHKYRPRADVIILTVAVNGSEIHEVDYPNIAFYGESVVDAVDKAVVVPEGKDRNYPRVRIEGHVQTSRKQTDSGTKFYQNFIGTTIAKAQTKMEQQTGRAGLGSHKADSENVVSLLGEVVNIFPITKEDADRPIGVNVTLKTVINGRTNFPRVSCFNGRVNSAMSLRNGDVACVIGYMETANRTNSDGTRTRFESIIASEIAKVDA